MENIKRYTLSALVSNKSGVLTRISSLFARRGYNIESLTVCATEDPEISRLSLILKGDEYTLHQMIKQINKLEDVITTACADEQDCIYRQLALIKVAVEPESRRQIVEATEIYKAKVVDFSPDTMVLEITGDPPKLDAFIKVIEPYKILEMQRTGVTVLARGTNILKNYKEEI